MLLMYSLRIWVYMYIYCLLKDQTSVLAIVDIIAFISQWEWSSLNPSWVISVWSLHFLLMLVGSSSLMILKGIQWILKRMDRRINSHFLGIFNKKYRLKISNLKCIILWAKCKSESVSFELLWLGSLECF